jgi:N-formylglutamate amidohydrolase
LLYAVLRSISEKKGGGNVAEPGLRREKATMYVQPGLLHRCDPTVPPLPIVVDVSRSGREYPPDMRSAVSFTTIHDNVSMYVEEIWGDTPKFGGTMLYALFPHMYIDANRHELDIDPELVEGKWPVELQPDVSKRGLGLLKSKSRYGEPVQEKKLTYGEVEDRLNRYHRPYHAELRSIVDRHKSAFGFVYHLTCHCMSAVGAPTHVDAGKERADFCIGDRNGAGASEEFVHNFGKELGALGYTHTRNMPYDGGEIVRRYGNPSEGIDSIMVEINKKRFMDTKTFRKTEGFDSIKTAANALLSALSKSANERIRGR